MNTASYIQKLRLLGAQIKQIEQSDRTTIYSVILPREPNKIILIIPDEVKSLELPIRTTVGLNDILKVIGGSGLVHAKGMFGNYRANEIDLSEFDTRNITDMSGMFRVCAVPLLNLKSLNTSKVVKMNSMFFGCQSKDIDLSNFDTHNVENMSDMFGGCEVDSLNISNMNTSNVKKMTRMFTGFLSRNLDLDLRNFDTHNVDNMFGMFSNCYTKTIDVSSFDVNTLDELDNMFRNCMSKVIGIEGFSN